MSRISVENSCYITTTHRTTRDTNFLNVKSIEYTTTYKFPSWNGSFLYRGTFDPEGEGCVEEGGRVGGRRVLLVSGFQCFQVCPSSLVLTPPPPPLQSSRGSKSTAESWPSKTQETRRIRIIEEIRLATTAKGARFAGARRFSRRSRNSLVPQRTSNLSFHPTGVPPLEFQVAERRFVSTTTMTTMTTMTTIRCLPSYFLVSRETP